MPADPFFSGASLNRVGNRSTPLFLPLPRAGEGWGELCCDMSPAFIAGVESHLPKASIAFDRFHIMQLRRKAVDTVRREEATRTDVPKRTRCG